MAIKWSPIEDSKLQKLGPLHTIAELEVMFGRSKASLYTRLYKLEIDFIRIPSQGRIAPIVASSDIVPVVEKSTLGRPWTEGEDDLLKEIGHLYTLKDLASMFDRSFRVMKHRCKRFDVQWIDGRTTDENRKLMSERAKVMVANRVVIPDEVYPGMLRQCPGPLHLGTEIPYEEFDWCKNTPVLREQCRKCWRERERIAGEAYRIRNRPEGYVYIPHRLAECENGGHRCSKCKILKSYDKFYIASPKAPPPCGYATICRECTDSSRLQRTYGITLEEFNWLLEKQKGVCRLCGKSETAATSNGTIHRLSVEHYHGCCGDDKGCKRCIRSIVCKACNTAIQPLEENSVLQNFINQNFEDYLQERPFLSEEFLQFAKESDNIV